MLKTFIVWLAVYPVIFVTYFIMSIGQALVFLFNSPVDVWNIVNDQVEKTVRE